MMMKWTKISARILTTAAVALALAAGPLTAQTTKTPPARIGTPFPELTDLQAIKHGGDGGNLTTFQLQPVMQGKLVIFFYWLAGNETSEDVLKELAAWAEGKDGVALVSIVPPRGKTAGQVAERMQELGLDIPCIWDVGYRLQQTLRVDRAPHISVVDKGGILRLAGAYNLRHKVLVDVTLQAYLETALGGGGAPSIVSLPRHYPVTELIDEKFMDFNLIGVPGGENVRLSDHVKKGQYALLVFWSPDCGHCKKELPVLNDYYMKHRDYLSLVGVVKVADDGIRKRTADFIRLHNLSWPTVDDKGFLVFRDYMVHSTPTTVVVNPEGIIETVLLGSSVDLDKELGPLIDRLKETQVASGAVAAGRE